MSPSVFAKQRASATLVTRINGNVKQNTVIDKDMIYPPERVLSWMSQSKSTYLLPTSRASRLLTADPGITIPAYNVIMTGNPAGSVSSKNSGSRRARILLCEDTRYIYIYIG